MFEFEELKKKKQVGFLKLHGADDVGSRKRVQFRCNQGKTGSRKRGGNTRCLSNGPLSQSQSIEGTLC